MVGYYLVFALLKRSHVVDLDHACGDCRILELTNPSIIPRHTYLTTANLINELHMILKVNMFLLGVKRSWHYRVFIFVEPSNFLSSKTKLGSAISEPMESRASID